MKSENYIENKFTIDELLKRGWRFKDSKEFVRFFDFISKFHHYSRYNTMLVYIQNSAVTFFGGVSYWKKKFNRTIKENARPYIILAPNGPVMLAYDIFDTNGRLSPEEFLEQGLGRKPFEVEGKIDRQFFYKSLTEAEKWGIDINTKPLSYFNAGYVTTIFKGHLEICLKEGMSDEENFAVFIHELAHLFLGHTGHVSLKYFNKEKPLKLINRELTRTAEELEAETVSYLICKKFGLETRAAEYIAGYITKEEDLLKFSYEIVIKTADKIEKLFLK